MTTATTGDVAVVTRGLVRDYGGGAGLHGIDLEVGRNEVYGLIGPNGAGKTTLLSILTGLRRHDAGTVTLSPAVGRVAMCPDTPEFEPWLTAGEVVRQSRALAGAGRRHGGAAGAADRDGAAGDPVARALERVGLTEAANRRTGGFSRGMKQRLSLAAAITLEPDLLILDEPSSALDPAGRVELFQLIKELADTRTVIFSSHILADVQRVASSVGVLDRGRLLFQGATTRLIEEYLRPAWNLRCRDEAGELARRLRALPWVTRVEVLPDGSLEVEATSARTGEVELPRAIAAAGAGLVSMNPVDDSLEAAFLALTGSKAEAEHGAAGE